MSVEDNEALTETDLSKRLNMSVKTLRNWRVKGSPIRYLKIGRLVRYRLSDVEAYEAAHLHGTFQQEAAHDH